VVEWHEDQHTVEMLTPWPEETESDMAVAARLQDAERLSSGIARFRLSRRSVGLHEKMCVPMKADLIARLGTCVVCSENVATVLMEPCGHLALCGACSESWTGRTCVLCRCPSRPLHLLSGVTPHPLGNVSATLAVQHSPASGKSAGEIKIRLTVRPHVLPYPSIGVNVRVADGLISIPSMEASIERLAESGNRSSKLDQRRAMRQASRLRTQTLRSGDRLMAGGVHAKCARQAQADAAWERWYQHCARWRCLRNHSRAELRAQPNAYRGQVAQYHKLIEQATAAPPGFNRRRYWRGFDDFGFGHGRRGGAMSSRNGRDDRSSHALAREAKRELAEWRRHVRQERQEMEAAARTAATEVVTIAARTADGPRECAACGKEEACMMHLPCRHVSLCQRCFDTTWQPHAPCALCRTASNVTLCVRRV